MSENLREADENDVEALTALINAAYAPAEGFLYDGTRITAAEVREKLEHGRFILDCDAGGAACGCVYVTMAGDAGHLGLLAVSPTRQKRGRGRSLARAAESHCRARGGRTMTLDVVNHRHDLVPFYASLGYAVEGERPFDDARLNRPGHFVMMSKALAPEAPARGDDYR